MISVRVHWNGCVGALELRRGLLRRVIDGGVVGCRLAANGFNDVLAFYWFVTPFSGTAFDRFLGVSFVGRDCLNRVINRDVFSDYAGRALTTFG